MGRIFGPESLRASLLTKMLQLAAGTLLNDEPKKAT